MALKTSTPMRELLQKELKQRCKSNAQYSMRAFAKSLALDPSRLSKILSGTRPVNNELIEILGKQLNFSRAEIEACKKINLTRTERKKLRENNEFKQLSLDTFEIISEWQHYAILELMKLNEFQPNARWISQKLTIPTQEVEEAVERLQRVGLLKIKTNGQWVDTSEGFSTHVLGSKKTSYAHKRYQVHVIQQGLKALNDVSIERRDTSSMMMATNKYKLEKAREMIKNFRRELCAFLEDTEEFDCVYQMGINLYPLTVSEE